MAGPAKTPPPGSGVLPQAGDYRFGIAVAEWHGDITEALYQGAFSALLECGARKENIIRIDVPGSFELIAGARSIVDHEKVHAVICLGCLIRGETPHFDFLGQAVAQGLGQLSVLYGLPFIFGVLTTLDREQALARAGGIHGNKGAEAALAAVKMAGLKEQFGRGRPIGF